MPGARLERPEKECVRFHWQAEQLCPSQELSSREREVVRLLVLGKSNQEIGATLQITESTVKFHVNNLMSKLGVNDRLQVVLAALKRGIISL